MSCQSLRRWQNIAKEVHILGCPPEAILAIGYCRHKRPHDDTCLLSLGLKGIIHSCFAVMKSFEIILQDSQCMHAPCPIYVPYIRDLCFFIKRNVSDQKEIIIFIIL